MNPQGQPEQSTVHVGSDGERQQLNVPQLDDSQPVNQPRPDDSHSMHSRTTSNNPSTTLPTQLQCPLCKELFTDAVVFPCCRFSSCRDCTKTEDFCPCCRTPDPMPVPNKNLRQMVQDFIQETGHSSKEAELPPRGSDDKDPAVLNTDIRFEDKYAIQEFIQEGGFGKVYHAKRKADAKEVVVKFIHEAKVRYWDRESNSGRLPLEVSLLSEMKHPNIVQFIDVFQNADSFQMVMDKHGDSIDLFDYINREPKQDEALCSYIFRQLVQAVSYLHSKSIVHRDIKDENIIIHRNFNVKLIDFGCAAKFHPDRQFDRLTGTLYYRCPEVVRGRHYQGPYIDNWSLGVLLYTLVFFEIPFENVREIIECVLEIPREISEDLEGLLHSILHPHQEDRYTMEDIEQDAWVQQSVDLSRYKWDDVIPKAVESKDN